MDPNKGMKRKYSSNMCISKATSCSTTGTATIVVSKEFPEGLRVLAVDHSSTCLQLLERMLQACGYEVTKCRRAKDALSILREKKNKFDIVISAVHIPDMDGFRLLDIIRLEMDDLPVVMVSSDEKKDVVMENIINGACDYLVKPVRMEAIKFIWQHVVRKQRNNSLKASLQLQSKKGEDGATMHHKESINDEDYASSSGDKENCGSSNIRKYFQQEDEAKDRDDAVSLKKPRMVWTTELHQRFMAAVNQIGLKNAVPKKILELMNVSGLTRENVASHLQKYRIYLQRQNSNLQHLHSQELNLKVNITSQLDNCKQQQQLHGDGDGDGDGGDGDGDGDGDATSTSSKLQQAGVESSHAIYSSGMALVDQRNSFFKYGGLILPESRRIFEIEHHQQQNNCNLQVNFPHQVSTMIDSEQLKPACSNQSVKLFGNMDLRMKEGGGAPYSLNLPTLRITTPLADSSNNHWNYPTSTSSPLMVQMTADGSRSSTIDYAVPLSSMINDFPKAHLIKLPDHHDFCLDTNHTSPNILSFVGNNNLEFTSYSTYEPTLFIERFDQDDLNLRPFDEQWNIGYVEAKPSFNGYLTDN